jgi:hypothetical protein
MSIRKEQKEGSSIIYLIDEENKTVTAKIPVKNMTESAYNDCAKYELPCWTVYEISKNYPHSYFTGIAKCAPEDTFDVETGKRIAVARMFQKYYRTKLNAMRKLAEEIDDQLTACEDLMNYSWLALDKFIKQEVNTTFSD